MTSFSLASPPTSIWFDVNNDTFGHWQVPWPPLQWNKTKALSLAYKLLFILSKNIVPSQSNRCLKMDEYSEIALFCDKLASPPTSIWFDVSNDTFGHWQVPWPPLQWNKMKALSLAYKLLFILSKNIVLSRSYRCLKMDVYSEIAHFCDKLASPYIYKVWCKQRYIWVLASTLDPSVSKINEALSVTYKLLFILSKNIVPSQRYRAFPVTRLPPPI